MKKLRKEKNESGKFRIEKTNEILICQWFKDF